jgi:hypothetical protein
MFLMTTGWLTQETAEQGNTKCSVGIADDLFQRAGDKFVMHLRNCSLSDLRLFRNRDDDGASRKLLAFFKERDRFTTQAWETMQATLSAVWDWAAHWNLKHYTFVHFACVALLEGRRYIVLDPPGPPLLGSNEDFIYNRTPDTGWHVAWSSFYIPASQALEESVQKPPIGFPIYLGATSHRDAANRIDAQQNYVLRCRRLAKEVIENTLLTSLDVRTSRAVS